jgi:hypothetical protein
VRPSVHLILQFSTAIFGTQCLQTRWIQCISRAIVQSKPDRVTYVRRRCLTVGSRISFLSSHPPLLALYAPRSLPMWDGEPDYAERP